MHNENFQTLTFSNQQQQQHQQPEEQDDKFALPEKLLNIAQIIPSEERADQVISDQDSQQQQAFVQIPIVQDESSQNATNQGSEVDLFRDAAGDNGKVIKVKR